MRPVQQTAALLLWTLCEFSLTAAPTITFNKDIAPIVFKSCAPCHRPGESGPFSLLRYEDARKHARQIAAVTASRYMPPWLPEPGYGEFAQEQRLTSEQIKTIAQWVAAGAPEGDAADLPPVPKFSPGWQLGEPDLVLTLSKSFTLAAEGSDVYRNFIFTFPLAGTKYVRALEIRPGNPRIVHHANLLLDRMHSLRARNGKDGQPGFFGMDLEIEANLQDPESHFLFWKPGSVIRDEPEGMSWPVSHGDDLVLNMHLQPSGKPEQVRPSLGLYFTDKPPRLHPLLVQLENDKALDIPPGASNFTVTDELTLPADVDLLGIYPHAHYLGKEVDGEAKLPDGSQVPLIRILHWDLNWQAVYRYRQPVFLPKGTKIAMRWVYDNSSANPLNPSHPPRRVRSGDRATDEMGHLWLQLFPRGGPENRIAIQEAVIRKRIARDPDDFTAHFNLGGVLQAQGDLQGAIREVREALRLHPRDETALNTLGAFLQLAGQPAEALASFRAALVVRPDYVDAHYNLASALLTRDDAEAAIPHLREILRLQPGDEKAKTLLGAALQNRAEALAGKGSLPAAIADFREIVRLTPEDADAHTNLGVALAMAGELPEAAQQLERALALNPRSEPARTNLEQVRASLAKK